MRMNLFALFAVLAGLWCGTSSAKAYWVVDTSPAPGYPVNNGGSGHTFNSVVMNGGAIKSITANSNGGCSASGPYATASSDYELKTNVVVTWNTMGPPPLLTLTFNAQASSGFSNTANGSGLATGQATTSARQLIATSGNSDIAPGSNSTPVMSQVVTFPSSFSQTFAVKASSTSSGTAYEFLDSFSCNSAASSGFSF